MALAQLNSAGVVDDLRVYLGLDEDSYEKERGVLVVDLAMERVEAVVSPVPALARSIVLEVARRGYDNPRGVQSETVGPFTRTFGTGSVGVYLTATEKEALQAIAAGGTTAGAFTITPGGRRHRRALDAAPGPW